MSWRDELRPASFRGVPFYVRSSSTEVGRRAVVHEVPFSDTPYPEDFGKAAGVFNVTGYVIQNVGNGFNYIPERDALISALLKKGEGTLVHPFYGEKQVVVSGKVRFDETFEQGGYVQFSIMFIEAGRLQVPRGVADHKGFIEGLADDLIEKAGETFTKIYDPVGPNFLTGTKGALGDMQKGLRSVRSALYKIQSTAAAEVSGVLATVASINNTVSQIINTPADIVEAMVNTFGAYRSLLPYIDTDRDRGESGVNAALDISVFGDADGELEAIPETTPTREQQAANREAMVAYFKAGGLAEAAVAAVNVEYGSYDQAWEMMTRISDATDGLLGYLADAQLDELYDQVMVLKPQLIAALLDLGASLPPVRYFTVPPEVYPSLVLAHRLYADLDREDELVKRNHVRMLHPGFPDGGEELEVLSE